MRKCMKFLNIYCTYILVYNHLHKSRYCDIVPLHNPLTKVATKSWASI